MKKKNIIIVMIWRGGVRARRSRGFIALLRSAGTSAVRRRRGRRASRKNTTPGMSHARPE